MRFQRREYGSTLALLRETLALDRNNFQALTLTAAVFKAQGLTDKADKALQSIVAKYPKSQLSKHNLARFRLNDGKYADTIKICEEVLRNDKNDAACLRIKAEAHLRRGDRGDRAQAAKLFNEILLINDRSIDAYTTLSRIYRASTLTVGEAEKLLLRGLEKLPKSFALRRELAETYIAQGRLDDAEKILEAVVEEADTSGTALLKSHIELFRAREEQDLSKKNERLGNILTEVRKLASSSDKNESYQGHLLLGKVYLQGYNDKTSAARSFEKARETLPAFPEPDVWLAPIYFQRGQFADCVKSLQKLNQNASTKTRLAIAAQAGGDLTAAERIAREALELPSEQKDPSIVVLANILINANKVAEAAKTIESAEQMDAELMKSYKQLARTLEGSDRHTVAAELNNGLFFFLSGQPKNVPGHYAEALERSGGRNIFLLMNLARSLRDADRFGEAEQKLETVVELRPNYLRPLVELSGLYRAQNKIKDAIDTYNKALKQDPNNTALQFELAKLYDSVDKLSEAQGIYSRIIKQLPEDGPALSRSIVLFRLGLCYEKQGQIEKALQAYDEAIELAPDSIETFRAYNNAAWHYAVKKDPNLRKALLYAVRAKDLVPGQSEVRDTLGWILYLSGDLDPAKGELHIAAMRLPTNGSVQYHYAVVLAELGEKDSATHVLEKAMDLTFPDAFEKKKAQGLLAQLKGTN